MQNFWRFFQKCIFQKYFFSDGFFSTIFFSLRIFWGCSFDAEIGPLSVYEVFRAIPALLHPVWSQNSDLGWISWQYRGSYGLRKFLVYTKCYLLPKSGTSLVVYSFTRKVGNFGKWLEYSVVISLKSWTYACFRPARGSVTVEGSYNYVTHH